MLKKSSTIIILCLFVLVLIFYKVKLFKKNQNNLSATRSEPSIAHTGEHISNQQLSLFAAVISVSQSVESGNIEELAFWASEAPDIYFQKSQEEMRRYLNIDKKTFAKKMKKNADKISAVPYPFVNSKDDIVHNAFSSLGIIQKTNGKFLEIVELKEFENQAKATVKFDSYKVGITNYEVLLIKKENNWKVFKFTFPEKWSRTYAETFSTVELSKM